jgi:hypothetical protein
MARENPRSVLAEFVSYYDRDRPHRPVASR